MQLLATINPENVSPDAAIGFRLRLAARAVVFDVDGNIALLYVSTDGYHKLPGGGMQPGEDVITALRRECREEIGCDIEITDELGRLIEYRKRYGIKQESFGYCARVVGSKGQPAFTDDEVRHGFCLVWLPLPQALHILEMDYSEDYPWRFIQQRDITYLQQLHVLEKCNSSCYRREAKDSQSLLFNSGQ